MVKGAPVATTATAPLETQRTSTRVRVQKFGTFLSNMVMPNIGAFIAWGFITALFIQNGWLNRGGNGGLAPDSWVANIGGWGDFAGGGIVGPMITYLLPLLIGYTGGKMLYDVRGGVVGAIATMGVIAGTDIPMFMGAMIMGPLGGWSMKRIDAIWDGKIRPGFEMLVNNFAAGGWGAALATLGFFVISPVVSAIADGAGWVVEWLVVAGLLPLTSIFIEPAKVLFLNNAINHGVLTPLGTRQSLEEGQSILFLLEANPGPGLGLLLAYTFFGRGVARASAPGAALIHFFGGIHEIYFPYVLAKPRLIAALILGGMTGVFTNVFFDSGLRAPAAPGSIIAVLLQTPAGSFVGVMLSVVLSATVTLVVAGFLLRLDRSPDEVDLAAATASMEAMKGKKSLASTAIAADRGSDAHGPIHTIVFACDAGMGSSAMGASVLRRKIQGAGFDDVTVVNRAISDLRDDVDLVVTHQDLTTRAQHQAGSAVHVSVDDFMGSPRYDEIVELLQRTNALVPVGAGGVAVSPGSAERSPSGDSASLLSEGAIRLQGAAHSMEDAITEAGELLVASGAVDASYVASMHERERSISTHMGNGLAIPHGTNDAKGAIRHSAMSFIRYQEPIDWKGKPATFVIGIAGQGEDHLQLLQRIAHVFLDKDKVAELESARSTEEVRAVLDR
jgi:mannitol PTS system EIICBA or EIICB component